MPRRRNRHPIAVAWCCRLYGLMIWCYPSALRREYRHELLVTFRNSAEDAFDAASVTVLLTFAMHTATDWLRTLMVEPEPPVTLSVLGLNATDGGATGCIDSSSVSVSLMLATLGVLLLIGGWYEWLHLNAAIISHHRIL